jgi:hypothetical protein
MAASAKILVVGNLTSAGKDQGARRLLCGGARGGVADRQPDGSVAEVGDQVKAPSQGLHVPGDDLEGGHLAVLDLGHAGDAHAHRAGDASLREA